MTIKKQIFIGCERKCFLLVLMLLAVPFYTESQEPAKRTDTKSYPQVSIPNTEMRPFFSKILNQEMEIYVKLPVSYDSSPQKSYPALYITDANYAFPMAANFMSLFEVPQPVEPEVCLIGIGYKIRDMNDWSAWRYRDLSLTNIPAVDTALSKMLTGSAGRKIEVKTGGAAKFLEFMAKEVLPFVESNYHVSSTGRGIAGYSLGGGFSLYVLFKQPDLFSLYYAGSPSIGNLFDFEKEYAS
jgi:uncharacterized protein